ncbi:Uncharacterised protein [Yersinia massiliensis]|uniref:hypothetical protein n=1 Tax=Yersinia massiliensis TaxID=419257 RepID=UPI0005DAAF33|nr:hypothetical protein [Yersinia massiliensis]CNH67867.1 Uncharacterised protein [Yersinia massiliensis]
MLDKTALILVSVLTASLMLSASTAAAEIPAKCRILSTGEWEASVNVQQSGPAKLIVLGEVETATGGYEVTLERDETALKPAIVTLDLNVVPPPADAMVSQMITPHAVKAEVPEVSRDLKRVVINCGGEKLMEITEISVLN